MLAWPVLDPVLAHVGAASLGAVLLIGAVEKLADRESFRDAVDNYRLLPAAANALVARALPLLEGLAGALLLPLATRALGAALALLVLTTVTAAIVVNLRRGRDRIDCGCGGALHTPLSRALVVRNALLMLLALGAFFPRAPRETVWLDVAAVGFATLFMLGLYVLANTLLSHHPRLLDLRNTP